MLSLLFKGNGNPLQCSCLENPRDGGAWWAAVYGVAPSRTRLKWLSSSSSRFVIAFLPRNKHLLITWLVDLTFQLSSSRRVTMPSWLSGSLKPLLYSSLYPCYLFLISSASVKSLRFLSFIMPILAWNVPLGSPILLKRSLTFPILLFLSFFTVHLGRLRYNVRLFLIFFLLHVWPLISQHSLLSPLPLLQIVQQRAFLLLARIDK